MSDESSKEPRKTAKQERSRATQTAIFDAMDRVVKKQGVETFSIADVAKEAGVGRASIYDFFPTREALVAAWEERIIMDNMARVGARVMELLANPPSMEESITILVEMVCDAFKQQADVFQYKERIGYAARSTVRNEIAERIVAMMANALAAAPDRKRIHIERLDVAARLIVHAVLNLARTLAATPMSDDDIVVHRAELAKMMYRYLLVDPVDVPR